MARSKDIRHIVELLRRGVDTNEPPDKTDKVMGDAADEFERLLAALGMCPVSATGKHEWAIFPTGQDGRIYQGPHPESGGAGAFCQLCQIPKSPYHDATYTCGDRTFAVDELGNAISLAMPAEQVMNRSLLTDEECRMYEEMYELVKRLAAENEQLRAEAFQLKQANADLLHDMIMICEKKK
jgi:hypothetical protein